METTYRLPSGLKDDIERLHDQVDGFRKETISSTEFRSFRVPMGIYEQREPGTYMLRVRLPGGALLPDQLRALAAVARRFGGAALHVTTRQDIQVHRVPLDALHSALLELHAAGLATKGGGGNTVRNVTSCWASGICPLEVFDVAPYAVAVTESLIPDPKSYTLPRKLKMAFSGCGDDCAAAALNDVGFVARERDGKKGFAVYAGGGLGASARVGRLLLEFVPADEAHLVAEAIKRVFDSHGNRRDRHRARLRFLVEGVGLEQFRSLYESALDEVRKVLPPRLEVRGLPAVDRRLRHAAEDPVDGFGEWRRRNVAPQRQPRRFLVHLPLPLGDVSAEAFDGLTTVAESYGDGLVRTTQWQNLLLTGIEEGELAGLHRELGKLGLASAPPAIVRNLVSCAGASTCKLGICLSRGLAAALAEGIAHEGVDLDDFSDLHIHVSGCPNACGRHQTADIGFFGAARRIREDLAPHYVVQLGGDVREGETRLASGKEIIPARNVPAFTVEFLRAFRSSPEFPNFPAFLEASGREIASRLALEHKLAPVSEGDSNLHTDWGADRPFSLAGRGAGECGAGVFDLIDVDLASAGEAIEEGRLHAAVVLAARALLVTQGHEARSAGEALDVFEREFIDKGLIGASFRSLIRNARAEDGVPRPENGSQLERQAVAGLLKAVRDLYGSLDQSLRFVKPAVNPSSDVAAPPSAATPDKEVDYRGVACPLNYVKTKMALAGLSSGTVLSVILNDEGRKKVPASVQADGHQVLAVEPEGSFWRVLIRKA